MKLLHVHFLNAFSNIILLNTHFNFYDRSIQRDLNNEYTHYSHEYVVVQDIRYDVFALLRFCSHIILKMYVETLTFIFLLLNFPKKFNVNLVQFNVNYLGKLIA